MGKQTLKISRKLRQKKQEKAILDRKRRQKTKSADGFGQVRQLELSSLLRKNIFPVSVLTLGCLLFGFISQADQRFSFPQRPSAIVESVAAAAPDPLPETVQAVSNTLELKPDEDLLQPLPSSNKLSLFEIADSRAESGVIIRINDPNLNPVATPTKTEQVTVEAAAKVVVRPTHLKTKAVPLPLTAVDTTPASKGEMADAIHALVRNTPMETMVDDIMGRDRAVAAFLLGIGMKESKYGIYSPKKDGAECYNYWGYRGRENPTRSGYSCFDSPAHAVQVVGDRIEALVARGLDTPAKMIVWKCGSTCAGHSPESVDKWIADVSINYYRLHSLRLLTQR